VRPDRPAHAQAACIRNAPQQRQAKLNHASGFQCAATGRPLLAWQAPRPSHAATEVAAAGPLRTAGGFAGVGDARSSRAACRWPSRRSSSSRRRCGARAPPAARPPQTPPETPPGSSAASRSASAASRAPGPAPLAATASTLPAAACSPRALAVGLPAAAGACGGGCEVWCLVRAGGRLAQHPGCSAGARSAATMSTSPPSPSQALRAVWYGTSTLTTQQLLTCWESRAAACRHAGCARPDAARPCLGASRDLHTNLKGRGPGGGGGGGHGDQRARQQHAQLRQRPARGRCAQVLLACATCQPAQGRACWALPRQTRSARCAAPFRAGAVALESLARAACRLREHRCSLSSPWQTQTTGAPPRRGSLLRLA